MPPIIRITIDDSKLRALIDASKGPVKPKVVADGVEYGIFQEIGTSRMDAHPFMTPAVEAVRPQFGPAFKQAEAISTDLAQGVVDKTAFDIERLAKGFAAVDTGAMKNSIHVVDGDQFGVGFRAEREMSLAEITGRGFEIVT